VLGLVPEWLEAPELFLRTVYIGAQLLVASLAAAGLQAATTGCSRVRLSSSSSSYNNAGENEEQQLDSEAAVEERLLQRLKYVGCCLDCCNGTGSTVAAVITWSGCISDSWLLRSVLSQCGDYCEQCCGKCVPAG